VVNDIKPNDNASLEQHTEFIKTCESNIRLMWVHMGQCLETVRDLKLYEKTHDSFEEYVEGCLGYKKSWAYEVISASTVAAQIPITSTSQARPLLKVPESQREEVWEKAKDIAIDEGSGQVTAKAVAEAVRQLDITEPDPASVPEPEPASEPAANPVKVDTKYPIKEVIDDLVAKIQILSRESRSQVTNKPGGHWFDHDQFTSDLKNAARLLRMAQPAADCPYCEGKGCDTCANLGWLPKGVWDSLPSSVREQNGIKS